MQDTGYKRDVTESDVDNRLFEMEQVRASVYKIMNFNKAFIPFGEVT